MSSQEHDLKQSEKIVGQIRPVLLAKDGRIIDGLHRVKANAKWRVETLEDVDTEEKYWVIRAHANYVRRNAKENREEKLKIINNLAAYYVKQGLRVSDVKPSKGGREGGGPNNEVLDAVIKALDGAFTDIYIRQNIDPKYKQNQQKKEKPAFYRKTPEDSIKGQFGPSRRKLANKVIKDLKKKAFEEAKEELRKDPEFIIEAASTAIEVLPTLQPTVIAPKDYHKPTLKKKQREQLTKAAIEAKRERQERGKDPSAVRKGELTRMLMALGSVNSVLHLISCPICEKPAKSQLVFKCSSLTIEQAIRKVEELREAL